GGSDEGFSVIERDDLQSFRGEMATQAAVAAARVQDPLAGLRVEQFEHGRAKDMLMERVAVIANQIVPPRRELLPDGSIVRQPLLGHTGLSQEASTSRLFDTASRMPPIVRQPPRPPTGTDRRVVARPPTSGARDRR